MKQADYKKHKGLVRQNLRDHITDLELIFSLLSEETAKDESVDTAAQGFEENRTAAIKRAHQRG